MRIVRLIIYGVLGYILGFFLGGLFRDANAQVNQFEKVQINSNNSVTFRGVIDDDSVLDAQFKLAKLMFKRGFQNYPIYLVMDSPGGSVEAGISLIEYAKIIPNLRTVTIFAASMAAYTVESLPGSRLITNNGELMFHRARGSFEGQFEIGEVESRLASAEAEVLDLENTVSKRLSISLIEYKAKVRDEWWLNAKQSMSHKAADKVVDLVCSEELIDTKIKASLQTFFGPVEVVYSGCPLFRTPLPMESVKGWLKRNEKAAKKN